MPVSPTTRTPSLAEVIRNALDSAFRECHVSLPAVVISYDATTQTAQVQPLLTLPVVDTNGNVSNESRPVINDVPVLFPSGGGYRLIFPVEAGDLVTLIMADQSLDIWKAKGTETDPIDLRTHDLSDAVAIPALGPKNAPWTVPGSGAAYLGKDGGIQLELTATEIHLGVGATHPLLLADTFLGYLDTFLTATSTATLATQIATAASTFKTSLLISPTSSTVKTS